jgi:transmembrane sensor
VTVRDVGTRFTVEQEPAGAVRVVVTEGAVDVSPSSGAATTRVAAGDVAVITAAGVDVRRGAVTADDLAWTRGRLVFHDATLASVLADLERWYGVEIQVRDPALLSRHFSGEFENLPADRVLQTLALALGTRLDRVADTTWLGNVPPAR